MPSRHSKGNGDRACVSNHEKTKQTSRSIVQRLGTESQLPFGYCALSLHPVTDAVASPSGRIYSREAILEYLLKKTRELKDLSKAYEIQEKLKEDEKYVEEEKQTKDRLETFVDSQIGISAIAKRTFTETEEGNSYMASRKKKIDDTDKETKIAQLKDVSPWIVQFTPSAKAADIKEPPKRPPSPFSGRPLRAKDLIPLNLEIERSESNTIGSAGALRYCCSVSRKTITNQKVVVIKTTGAVMLESIAKDLAYPTLTCPVTATRFKMTDVVELVSAASGFSASGTVEAKKYKPTMN